MSADSTWGNSLVPDCANDFLPPSSLAHDIPRLRRHPDWSPEYAQRTETAVEAAAGPEMFPATADGTGMGLHLLPRRGGGFLAAAAGRRGQSAAARAAGRTAERMVWHSLARKGSFLVSEAVAKHASVATAADAGFGEAGTLRTRTKSDPSSDTQHLPEKYIICKSTFVTSLIQ